MNPTSCLLLLTTLLPAIVHGGDLVYRLPTANDALLRHDGEGFYMYCDRKFEGQVSKPWQAGQYGMVRNPFRASNGQIMFSRIHEGIDIKPTKRDAQGEPLDEIHPVAPGTVAYVSEHPGLSNYGRYVVIAHQVPEGTFYTLYAHMARVSCSPGQRVGTGNILGIMGHSGAGLNRVRSHCHVEICFMIHSDYEQFSPPQNKHGNFNGLNLAGFDISGLLKQCASGEPASLSEYISRLPEHYRVRVPCTGTMDLLRRHPFLYKGSWEKRPPSLDMAFTAEGVPIAVYPSTTTVSEPVIISCKSMPTLQQNCTVNRVKNSSKDAALTVSGKRYINQFLWQKEAPAASAQATTQEP